MRRILIASDHAGFKLKEALKDYLRKRGIRVEDFGTYSPERCDYPLSASALASRISASGKDTGILICYTGIGNSIVANRFPGVRAALCYNLKAARLCREHNDSNLLVLGAGFLSPAQAKKITAVWLKTPFSGGRHKRRLGLLKKIEKRLCRKP